MEAKIPIVGDFSKQIDNAIMKKMITSDASGIVSKTVWLTCDNYGEGNKRYKRH